HAPHGGYSRHRDPYPYRITAAITGAIRMSTALPHFVIISGPPGGGKSTLARPLANALGLPLLEKDRVKERFADSLGEHAASISRNIGLAAVQQIIATADEILRSGNG